MVAAPDDYRWSSYRCNSLGSADAVIAPHPLYLALGEDGQTRRDQYRNLFADAIPAADLTALRAATNGGFVLGSDRFQREIAAMGGRRMWPGTSGRPKKQAPDENQLDLPSEDLISRP